MLRVSVWVILLMRPFKQVFGYCNRGITFANLYILCIPLLCLSTGAVDTVYQSRLIMTDWDDDEVKV